MTLTKRLTHAYAYRFPKNNIKKLAHSLSNFNNRARQDVCRAFMAIKKKEIEKEVIVTNVGSKGDSVILDLRLPKPRFEEPTEQRLENIIEPLPKSAMEKAGRDVARGYMDQVQKQIRLSPQSLARILPPTLPPDTIQITLSKQEYEEIGRPTVFGKLTLKLTP